MKKEELLKMIEDEVIAVVREPIREPIVEPIVRTPVVKKHDPVLKTEEEVDEVLFGKSNKREVHRP